MMKKISLTTLVLVSIVITCAFIQIADAVSAPPTAPPTQPPTGVPKTCAEKCAYRCSRNPRNLCKTLCISCCAKCNQCVPSGPFADKSECPCYRDIKTKKGLSKCP
ncbi:hypothetical protein SOVF_001590 [Spinacia oleracea]|uniref:Peamaclein n=1 Tax=Spinacia oleracea TaxID=3562 RepID=A0A9R0JUW9_SPIOL|nr:peamaclein-like [Spinacia oleracea]KNA25943.1 hypothetical protein SOVF_001590 [Spinacia oleracea]